MISMNWLYAVRVFLATALLALFNGVALADFPQRPVVVAKGLRIVPELGVRCTYPHVTPKARSHSSAVAAVARCGPKAY